MKKPNALTCSFIAGVALVAAGASMPTVRHYVVARLNDPAALPELASDPRVRFEPAARACAGRVAELLPAAMARVEAEQGRAFASPPIVGVYASFETYARANAVGSPLVAGVSWSGRITLSPSLCGAESGRLPGILTHELSHSHLFGWRSTFVARPPSWFAEGLAVLVSDGGGAEGVSDAQAARAIRDGYVIVVDDDTRWLDFSSIEFAIEPPRDPAAADPVTPRQRLAYREAALFVAFLREADQAAFKALLGRLLDGEAFAPAFEKAYGRGFADDWKRFRAKLSTQ